MANEIQHLFLNLIGHAVGSVIVVVVVVLREEEGRGEWGG